MRILIVGSGGREHAITWALANSSQNPELFIAPGNPGTAELGTNVPISVTNIEDLLRFAAEKKIDLTIVGPEQPLVAGIVDRFEEKGHAIVGPTAAAAQLEGSKSFAKAFMNRWSIPTAAYRRFEASEVSEAEEYVKAGNFPVVLKADGLAAGKGVLICETEDEALAGLSTILREGGFGEAGLSVVVEEFMEGEEASVFAITDGTDYVVLSPAQDHKRAGDGDTGPNTGGMGAYAPAPVIDQKTMEVVCETVIEPTLAGMAAEGNLFAGVLYCGLMITPDGPKVVEYNCRFGDPETQVVLPLLTSDFVELMERVASRRLGAYRLERSSGAAATVVLASGGYPAAYEKGFLISGLKSLPDQTIVFHAGTRYSPAGEIVTNGGRVVAVTGVGEHLQDAVEKAYEGAAKISFEGVFSRSDIGWRGLQRDR